MSERVNLFDPRQLAIASVVLVVGIGGDTFERGNLPFFDWSVPAIASAAVAGILLNLLFLLLDGLLGERAPRSTRTDYNGTHRGRARQRPYRESLSARDRSRDQMRRVSGVNR